MKYIFDNDLHIHSRLSLCSNDPEQTPELILDYAVKNSLKTVCLTDHYWDEKVRGASDWYKIQNIKHISASRPLPQADSVRFLFGCETDMDKHFTVGISPESYDEFDFIVIPTTHLHMTGFTINKKDYRVKRRAELWVERFNALLNMDLPFEKVGIAHLTCSLIDNSSRENYLKVLSLIQTDELKRLFSRAAKLGCGIELNLYDMKFSDSETDTVLRIYRVAKDCGCKFYMGSDVHHPEGFDDAQKYFNRAIDLLELTEEDKFIIK